MEIYPKTTHLLQSQVAAFAATNRIVYGGHLDMLPNTSLAHYNKQDYADYVHYLRNQDLPERTIVKNRSLLLENFNQFKYPVQYLYNELEGLPLHSSHDSFLGQGNFCSVFRICLDENDFALRIPRDPSYGAYLLDHYISSGIRGRGIPRIEQVVAASYDTDAVISEIIPGKQINLLTIEEINAITPNQLVQIIEIFTACHEADIHIDIHPPNFLYDHDSGFHLVDYHIPVTRSRLAVKLAQTPSILMKGFGVYKKWEELSKLERWDLSLSQITLLEKYLKATELANLSDKDKLYACDAIDRLIRIERKALN